MSQSVGGGNQIPMTLSVPGNQPLNQQFSAGFSRTGGGSVSANVSVGSGSIDGLPSSVTLDDNNPNYNCNPTITSANGNDGGGTYVTITLQASGQGSRQYKIYTS